MNKFDKQSVQLIVAMLTNKRIAKVKGIVFIKPDPMATDWCHIQTAMMTRSAGGAAILRLNTQSLLDAVKSDVDSFALEVLSAANPQGEEFYVVSIQEGAWKSEHSKRLPFLIAHELGHIHYSHHIGTEVLCEITSSVHPHEFEADAFANELLGSKEPAQSTFIEMIARVFEAQENLDNPDVISQLEDVLIHLRKRLAFSA